MGINHEDTKWTKKRPEKTFVPFVSSWLILRRSRQMSAVASLKLSHEPYLRPTSLKAELFVDANHRRAGRTSNGCPPALLSRVSQRENFQRRRHATAAIFRPHGRRPRADRLRGAMIRAENCVADKHSVSLRQKESVRRRLPRIEHPSHFISCRDHHDAVRIGIRPTDYCSLLQIGQFCPELLVLPFLSQSGELNALRGQTVGKLRQSRQVRFAQVQMQLDHAMGLDKAAPT